MITPNVEPRTVKLADLVLNPAFQMRTRTNPATVENYRQVYKSGGEMPPISVALVDGAPCLVDGWHRVAAAKKLGWQEIAAIVTVATTSEALWLAAQANLKHGLPLKPAEHRKVFLAYVKNNRHRDQRGRLKRYREIGADLGKPHTTIRNWMKKHFPKIARELSDDDTGGKKGGLMDQPQVSLADHATEHLKAALAAARGVKNSSERGALVALTREVLAEIEKAGEWELPNDDF